MQRSAPMQHAMSSKQQLPSYPCPSPDAPGRAVGRQGAGVLAGARIKRNESAAGIHGLGVNACAAREGRVLRAELPPGIKQRCNSQQGKHPHAVCFTSRCCSPMHSPAPAARTVLARPAVDVKGRGCRRRRGDCRHQQQRQRQQCCPEVPARVGHALLQACRCSCLGGNACGESTACGSGSHPLWACLACARSRVTCLAGGLAAS